MLENWLNPVNLKNLIPLEALSDHQWGKNIIKYTEDLPDLSKVKIAIVGIDEDVADAVRSQLYILSMYQPSFQIADLGNIKKVNPEFLILLHSALLDSGIMPIFLGKHRAYTYPMYMSYLKQEQPINTVIIDERVPYTFDYQKRGKDFYYLNQLIDKRELGLFNLSVLGFQSHFCDPAVFELFENHGYELLRLGKMKNNLMEAEPSIRDADFVSFDISAIRYADAPGTPFPSPSGIFSEEASQLTYFAGLSDKLTSLGIFGYHPDFDWKGLTAQLIAQMIWYFADGVFSRKQDLPFDQSRYTRYQVNPRSVSSDLVFWKSKKTERWWVQVSGNGKEASRDRIIPCSANDYKLACQGELTDRYLSAVKRFDQFKEK